MSLYFCFFFYWFLKKASKIAGYHETYLHYNVIIKHIISHGSQYKMFQTFRMVKSKWLKEIERFKYYLDKSNILWTKSNIICLKKGGHFQKRVKIKESLQSKKKTSPPPQLSYKRSALLSYFFLFVCLVIDLLYKVKKTEELKHPQNDKIALTILAILFDYRSKERDVYLGNNHQHSFKRFVISSLTFLWCRI